MGIISILIGSALGYYVWAPEKARRAKMVHEMDVFHKAALRYYAKTSGWPKRMSDLIGLGVLKMPPDPWGGEYRIEEEYYITCRPPNGDPYRVPFCPKILYKILGDFWLSAVVYNRREVDEKMAKGTTSLIKARVRLEIFPVEGSTFIEYKTYDDSVSVVTHPAPSNMIFFGTITDGFVDPETGLIVDDDAMMDYIIRTGYKFLLNQSGILYTYFYEFGKTDGDVDLDRKQEFRIAYDEDRMEIFDINEDVDGIDKDYLEDLIEKSKKRRGILYNMNGVMMLWNPDYHCRWSVTN